MHRISAKQRSEAKFAGSVIDSIFDGTPASAKESYLKFLVATIDFLSAKYPNTWGATLFGDEICLNAGPVVGLALHKGGLIVLVEEESAPKSEKLWVSHGRALGCYLTTVPLADLKAKLPSLKISHRNAISISARNLTTPSIRNAHSIGITKFLSQFVHRPIPDPLYIGQMPLHLLNGGFGNNDKQVLERAARGDGRVGSWVVPKSAAIGDQVVINVAKQGLFATGRIASGTKPRADWHNRYGARLDCITLIVPPISLEEVQREIPGLGWARYARSIATPSPEIATEIRHLIGQQNATGEGELTDAKIASASIEELRRIALLQKQGAATPKQREILVLARSKAIRKYVLKRAKGLCEGCSVPAPFLGTDGLPFLEAHHTIRRAEEGPDDLWSVIALCPNCHRRTDAGQDARSFNDSLIKKLAKLEPKSKKC